MEDRIVPASVIKMPTGKLSMSRIVYFTDMQHSDSHEIPIGVAAEATLDGLSAIGVALRPGFSQFELDGMGPIGRQLLDKPVSTLWPELKAIFEEASPGHALELFGQRHSGSLSVFSPAALPVPRQWLLQPDSKKLATVVADRMKVAMIDAYYDQLFPSRIGTVADPAVEEAHHKAA
jgi:hypothetical protein